MPAGLLQRDQSATSCAGHLRRQPALKFVKQTTFGKGTEVA